MPEYTIRDPQSGRLVTVRGDSPPSESELEEIFKAAGGSAQSQAPSLAEMIANVPTDEAGNPLPKSPLRTALEPLAHPQTASDLATLAIPGGADIAAAVRSGVRSLPTLVGAGVGYLEGGLPGAVIGATGGGLVGAAKRAVAGGLEAYRAAKAASPASQVLDAIKDAGTTIQAQYFKSAVNRVAAGEDAAKVVKEYSGKSAATTAQAREALGIEKPKPADVIPFSKELAASLPEFPAAPKPDVAPPIAPLPVPAEPIQAYHGSPHDFTAFDIGKAGSTTDAGLLGKGVYTSTDPKVVKAGEIPYQVALSVKRPLEIKFPAWQANKTELVTDALGLPHSATPEQITAAAKKLGYDGVRLDYSPVGYNHQEIVAFDPSDVAITSKGSKTPPMPQSWRPYAGQTELAPVQPAQPPGRTSAGNPQASRVGVPPASQRSPAGAVNMAMKETGLRIPARVMDAAIRRVRGGEDALAVVREYAGAQP